MPVFIEPDTVTTPRIAPGILDQLEEETESPWVVILYNDDWHPIDQVVHQIQLATGCSQEKAEWITLEAHHTGRAVAFSGTLERCEKVAQVLRAIRLQVEMDKSG